MVKLVFVVMIWEVVVGVGVVVFGVVRGCQCCGFCYFQQVVQFQCFDMGGIEGLVFVFEMGVGDVFMQFGQFLYVFFYQVVFVEYIEVILYGVL